MLGSMDVKFTTMLYENNKRDEELLITSLIGNCMTKQL